MTMQVNIRSWMEFLAVMHVLACTHNCLCFTGFFLSCLSQLYLICNDSAFNIWSSLPELSKDVPTCGCLCIVIQLTFQFPTAETCIHWTYRRVIRVSMWTPQSYLCQPVSGVINKDCIQAECLYSSQIQHINCKGTGASWLPTHHQLPTLHYSQQLLSSHRPSAWINTNKLLLSHPEIR